MWRGSGEFFVVLLVTLLFLSERALPAIVESGRRRQDDNNKQGVENEMHQEKGNGSLLKDSCNCGLSELGPSSCGGRQGRVIGGREAAEKEIPWQVNIESCLYKDHQCDSICGGSIIGRKYILTAAHCLHHRAPYLRVVLGDINLRAGGNASKIHRISSIRLSDAWDPIGAKGDIALLRLKEDIEFSPWVKPLCLPSSSEELYLHKPAIVSGWGVTSEDSFYPSSYLRRALLCITSNDDQKCLNTDPNGRPLQGEYLCAHGVDADACHMDSGGPLTVLEENSKRCVLAGIISYGRGCARTDYAGVYTRVSKYLDWIREKTLDDDCLNH